MEGTFLTESSLTATTFSFAEATVSLPLGAEDFSFFLEHSKGAFYHLGCRNEEKNILSPLHTADFDIDEDCLEIGVMLHVLNTLSFARL